MTIWNRLYIDFNVCTQFCRIRDCDGANLSENPIHLRYPQNILILRLYEQFSRNDSAMAPDGLTEKNSDLYSMNILYNILKYVIWRFL